MDKKLLLISALALGVVVLLVFITQTSNSELSEAELREKFRCDRVTTEVLATDIYCQNPSYYYEDAANDTVIDGSDYNDPRFEALYEN